MYSSADTRPGRGGGKRGSDVSVCVCMRVCVCERERERGGEGGGQAHMHRHAQTRAHAHTRTRTHAHPRAHTHTHTHPHTHAHTHTRTQKDNSRMRWGYSMVYPMAPRASMVYTTRLAPCLAGIFVGCFETKQNKTKKRKKDESDRLQVEEGKATSQ